MKKEKVKLKFKQTFRTTLVLGAGLCLLLTALILLKVFDGVELKLLDTGFKKRKPIVKREEIITIDIDDSSISQLGRWPWSWDLHAGLVDFLAMYKARAVTFIDMDFSREVPLNLPEEAVNNFKSALYSELSSPVSKPGATVLPDSNRAFYSALGRKGDACFAVGFKIIEGRTGRQKALQFAESNAALQTEQKRGGIDQLKKKVGKPGKVNDFTVASDILPPVPDILKASKCFGFNNIVVDQDGVVRRYPLISYYRGNLYPSIGLQVAKQLMGASEVNIVSGKFVELQSKNDNLRIPINNRGEMLINWVGEYKESFDHIPFNLVASFIGMQTAKNELAKYNIETMEDPTVLNSVLVKRLNDSRLVTPDQANYLGTVVFVSSLIEYYMVKGNFPLEEVLASLGIDKQDKMWLNIGRQIYFNNLLVKKSRGPESVPEFNDFKRMLKDVNFPIDASLDFSPDEFKDGLAIEALCEQLINDKFHLGVCNVESLNGLLKRQDLYAGLIRLKPTVQQSEGLKVSKKDYDKDQNESNLKELNRVALEDYYPHVTPKNKAQYRDVHKRMKYYVENNLVDKVRPLYLDSAKMLKQGGKEISITPMFFRDKAVFYGLTATGLVSQNATPFSPRQAMLDMVPNVLNTISTRNFIDIWKYLISYAYLFAVLFCVLLLSPLTGFLLAVLTAGSHISLAWFGFTIKGYILPVSQPVTAIFGAYLSAVAYRYFQEQKERKKVRGMFSTMVSPEVLKMMEENPEKFRLAGEKREATIFSSDVSGFTTISEGVTARELANILNIYLTPMSNIIMSYNGYIDKYEGDAIKADFGVPLHDPDHSWKACLSALYQQEELKVIQRLLLLKYGVKVTARMGINTGMISAGNMGSEKRMQFTVMGEAATLAEELEPANKLFETWIAIGPDTYEQAGDYIEVRYLNNLIMGAAKHSVPVYELAGWKKEKFLQYWLGKPVPELIIEAIKKMSPEKVLAYHDFYSRKELPESAILTEIKGLFAGLKDKAVEYMRTTNIMSVLFIREEMDRLRREMKRHEQVYAGLELPANIVKDLAALKHKMSSEAEEWGRVLLQWRIELREYTAYQYLLRDKIAKEENDQYLNIIDVLEKSVVCISKRITFPLQDDEIAVEMSGHLKALLTDNTLASDNIALTEKSLSLQNEIKSRLSVFADGLKLRADEYHTMMADFCTMSVAKRKVIEIYGEGHKHYLNREWDRALEKFREGLAIVPDDGPCIMLIKKIEGLKKDPPPEDWDGAWEE